MASQPVIFLDDGGVMNDNSQRSLQGQRLVSAFFVPRLGGTPEAWMEANRLVVQRMLAPENWRMRLQAAADYASFQYSDQLDWLRGMCELVGIPAPPIILGRSPVSYADSTGFQRDASVLIRS